MWGALFLATFFAANHVSSGVEWFGLEYLEGYDAGDHVLTGHTHRIIYGRVCGDPYWDLAQDEAVYWDLAKKPHLVRALVPTDEDGFLVVGEWHFLLNSVESFEPHTGTLYVIATCMEWWQWRKDNLGHDAVWDGPKRRLFEITDPSLQERSADFNGDGIVDTRDQVEFLRAWSAQRGP